MQQPLPRIVLAACLTGISFGLSPCAHARQAPPSMDGMAAAIQKRQAEAMKTNYGFSDRQIKKYFQKESQINGETQAQLTVLRKRLVATKDKEARRRIAAQMRSVVTGTNKRIYNALVSVATPLQRQKIASP